MTRRSLFVLVLAALLAVSIAPAASGVEASSDGARVARVVGGASFRPDAWIKLCGLSLGCRIDPPPHPWRGKDVYNSTGRRQTVAVDVNEGEGVRFWITVQNDGAEADTLVVQGCRGTRTFEVNSVLIGEHRRQDAGATNVTRKYKSGTLTFDLDPREDAVFTLNVITHFNKGVTYRCITAVRSQNDGRAVDAVVAQMTTY